MTKNRYIKFIVILSLMALMLALSVNAINIDIDNPTISQHLIDLPGVHSSISAIRLTVVEGARQLVIFFVNDIGSYVEYVNSLNWNTYHDLSNNMGLNQSYVLNIVNSYYSNFTDFRALINSYGQYKYAANTNTTLNTRISQLENEITNKDLEISSLNGNISYLINEIALLQSSNDLLDEEIVSLNNHISTLESEIIYLNNQLPVKYSEGYSQGFNDREIFLDGLTTVFSSPIYVFGEIFDFEFLGFNILTLIQMLLTTLLLAFIFKKLR